MRIYGTIRKRNGKLKEAVIYEGQVITYAGMISVLVYDPATGNLDVHSEDANTYLKNNPLPQNATVPNGGNYDAVGNGYTNNNNGANNTIDNNAPDNNSTNNSNGPVASPVAMQNIGTLTDSKVSDIKTKVEAKKTDTDKMKVLKDELKNERVGTDNVAMMMDWLNFESTKLEFAKWAYTIVEDKENFAMLGDKFTYKTYQDEFDQFAKEHK
jgi:hypothetical protein